MLTALIFGTDRETTSQLQQLCSLTQDVCVFRTLERYPQAHESMRLLNSFAPQLVFLGADDEAAAHAVEHDIRSILPSTAILGVSALCKRRRHVRNILRRLLGVSHSLQSGGISRGYFPGARIRQQQEERLGICISSLRNPAAEPPLRPCL